MFFHLNVHVLRERYENEFHGIIYHLEKEYKVHFQLTKFNEVTTALMSLQAYSLEKVNKITLISTL